MGGGPRTSEYQRSVTRNILDPRIEALLFPQLDSLAQLQQDFIGQSRSIAEQMQIDPSFGGPDAVTRAQMAMGQQGLLNQAEANRAEIARNVGFGAGGQALQRIAGMQSSLQANPLMFQAMQEQRTRELQGMQARNAALLQQLGAYQAPSQSLIGALNPLLQAGQATGSQFQYAEKGEKAAREIGAEMQALATPGTPSNYWLGERTNSSGQTYRR